jgi:hypothetical protein
MVDWSAFPMIRQCYRKAFGAALDPVFDSYLQRGLSPERGAALGYSCAGTEQLFLERYVDVPIEVLASAALGRMVPRERIVEIGNFAAGNALAMIGLWGAAANDLAGTSEIACATLTAPLRAMFARIGVPFHIVAPARAERLGGDGSAWGNYYQLDPWICIGEIGAGQQALTAFLARRARGRGQKAA